MINGVNQYDARKTDYNKLLNAFVDELLATIRVPKSRVAHMKAYSSMYELYKNSNARGEIESCHSLVLKLQCGDYTTKQRAVAADRLRDKILYLADNCLLNVKRERRLECNNFAKMIKAIIVQQDLFDKYIEYSDLSIKNYYEAQQSALKDTPRSEITYSSLNKMKPRNKIF